MWCRCACELGLDEGALEATTLEEVFNQFQGQYRIDSFRSILWRRLKITFCSGSTDILLVTNFHLGLSMLEHHSYFLRS